MRRIRFGLLTAGALALLAVGGESARADDCDLLRQQDAKAKAEVIRTQNLKEEAEATAKEYIKGQREDQEKQDLPDKWQIMSHWRESIRYQENWLKAMNLLHDRAVRNAASIAATMNLSGCDTQQPTQAKLPPPAPAQQAEFPPDMQKLIDGLSDDYRDILRKAKQANPADYNERIRKLREAALLPPLPGLAPVPQQPLTPPGAGPLQPAPPAGATPARLPPPSLTNAAPGSPAVPKDSELGFSTHNFGKDFVPGGKCPAGSRFEVCKFGAGALHPGSKPTPAGGVVGCVEPRWENHFCSRTNPEANCKCEQRGADVPSRAELNALAPPTALQARAPSLTAAGNESARAKCDSLAQEYWKYDAQAGDAMRRQENQRKTVVEARERHDEAQVQADRTSAPKDRDEAREWFARLLNAQQALAQMEPDIDNAIKAGGETRDKMNALDCFPKRGQDRAAAAGASRKPADPVTPADRTPDTPADRTRGAAADLEELIVTLAPGSPPSPAGPATPANRPPDSIAPAHRPRGPAADLEELIVTLAPGSTPSGTGVAPGSEEPPLVIPELPEDIVDLIRKLRETDKKAGDDLERKLKEKNREEAIERRRREAAEKKREAAEQQKRREAAVKPAAPATPPASTPPAPNSTPAGANSCPAGQVRVECGGTDFWTDGCQPNSTVQATVDRYKKSHPDIPCKIDGKALPLTAAAPPMGLHALAPARLPPPVLSPPQIAAAPPAVLHTPPQPPPEHTVPVPPKEQKQARHPRPQRQVNRGQGQAQAQAQAQAQQDAAAAAAAIAIIGIVAGAAASSGPSYSQPRGHYQAPAPSGHHR